MNQLLGFVCVCLSYPSNTLFMSHVSFDDHNIFFLQIRNEKAKRFLNTMRSKQPIPLSQKLPNADPLALRLLERMLAFDPLDRPSAEEVSKVFAKTVKRKLCYLSLVQPLDERDFSLQALADPYFYGLANLAEEPSRQPISKLEFDFERRRITKDDVRELIYREVCVSVSRG